MQWRNKTGWIIGGLVLTTVLLSAYLNRAITTQTYTFVEQTQPVALGRLDASPAVLSDTHAGYTADLSAGNQSIFNSQIGAGEPISTFHIAGHAIPVTLKGSQPARTAKQADVRVVVTGALPDTELQYDTHRDFVKETVTVRSKAAAQSLTFIIPKADGLELRAQDAGIMAVRGGKPAFYLHGPTASDATGTHLDYTYTLGEENGSYTIELRAAQPGQLDAAAFPIVIDPTISWNFTSGAPYYLSDPTKIEVSGGVVRLVNNGGVYATDNPFVVTNTPTPYSALSSFSETLGANNQGVVRYQLSKTGNAWYYWNGSTWATANATDYNQANPAGTVQAQIGSFATQLGAGSVYIKAFLHTITRQIRLVLCRRR